ncbi:hypothetical protein GY50_0084 [Dehalococcoides mccartyi GY50]|nr:hypothetical protein GY50_0084 [Dehalococcoides mccartyi GY50]
MEQTKKSGGKEIGRGQNITVVVMVLLITLLAMAVIFMKVAGIELYA